MELARCPDSNVVKPTTSTCSCQIGFVWAYVVWENMNNRSSCKICAIPFLRVFHPMQLLQFILIGKNISGKHRIKMFWCCGLSRVHYLCGVQLIEFNKFCTEYISTRCIWGGYARHFLYFIWLGKRLLKNSTCIIVLVAGLFLSCIHSSAPANAF